MKTIESDYEIVVKWECPYCKRKVETDITEDMHNFGEKALICQDCFNSVTYDF